MMWYPGASLYYRKQLARPFYWLGFRIVRFADWVDGKQPRNRKAMTHDEIAQAIQSLPGATKEEIIAAFGSIKLRKRAREVLEKHDALLRRLND